MNLARWNLHWKENRSNILQRDETNRWSMGNSRREGNWSVCDASWIWHWGPALICYRHTNIFFRPRQVDSCICAHGFGLGGGTVALERVFFSLERQHFSELVLWSRYWAPESGFKNKNGFSAQHCTGHIRGYRMIFSYNVVVSSSMSVALVLVSSPQ